MKQLCIVTATLCSALVIGPASGYAQQTTDIGKQEYVISCADPDLGELPPYLFPV